MVDRRAGRPDVDEVGIGIVGYGLMGRAHAHGYTVAPHVRDARVVTPRLRAISGRDAAAVASRPARYGVEEWTVDWRELVARDDVDIVDVCTPPGAHAEVVRRPRLPARQSSARSRSQPTTRRRGRAGRCGGRSRRAQRDRIQLPAAAGASRCCGSSCRTGAVGEVLLWRGSLALGRVPRSGHPLRLAVRAAARWLDVRRPRCAPRRPRALDRR